MSVGMFKCKWNSQIIKLYVEIQYQYNINVIGICVSGNFCYEGWREERARWMTWENGEQFAERFQMPWIWGIFDGWV